MNYCNFNTKYVSELVSELVTHNHSIVARLWRCGAAKRVGLPRDVEIILFAVKIMLFYVLFFPQFRDVELEESSRN